MKNTLTFLKGALKENAVVVLGLSGGPDSMCLFHMLLELREKYNLKIIGTHVNHNVRSESEEEEKFVRRICKENNCLFESIKLNIKEKTNFECKARTERYAFFNQVINKYQANFLMTAHHGDDLTETILMHLTRGSNLSGYAGFKKRTIYPQYELLRPLIYMTKEEILVYCHTNGIEYRVDKSNENEMYTRNRYRKHLLPFLKQENKKVHHKFLKFSEELEQVEEYLEKNAKIALTHVYDFDKVNLHEWKQLDSLMKKRVIEYILEEEYQNDISKINEKHVELVLNLCESVKPNMCVELPLRKKIVKEYDTLYFYNKEKKNRKEYKVDKEVKISDFEKLIQLDDTDIQKSNFIIRLNSNEIALPLKIRTRKEKDKMEVKNLKGTKKIKDIFIDEKVPKSKRDEIPILVDNNGTILWILGLKKSKFDKNKDEFYDIIYKYVISEEQKNEQK